MAREIDPALLAELQRRGIVAGRHAVSEGTKSGQRAPANGTNGVYGDMPLAPPQAPPGQLPPGVDPSWLQAPEPSTPTADAAPTWSQRPPAAGLLPDDALAKASEERRFHAAAKMPFKPKPVEGDFAKPKEEAPGAGAPGTPSGSPPWTPPAGQVVPGGWGKTISPETQSLYEKYFAKQEGANATAAKAALESNEALAKAEENQAARIGEDRLNSAMRDAVNKDALDRQFEDYKRLQQDAAEQKIDPGRWWGSKSGAEKALGIVAMALGAAGQGLTHGRMPNMAAQLIERAVDRDIDAQKSEMQGKAHAAEIAGNLYSMKLRQFGDERAADAAARAQMYEQYRLQMHAEALRAGSPTLQAAAEQADAMLAAKQAEYHRGIEKYVAAQKVGGLTEKDFARAAEIYKDAAANGKPMTETQALQAAVALRGGAPNTGVDVTKTKEGGPGSFTVNLPEGGTAEALDKDAQEKWTTHQRGYDEFMRGIREMEAIRKKHGGGAIVGPDIARAKQIKGMMVSAFSKMNSFNRTPNESEMHQLEENILPTATDLSATGGVDAMLRGLREDAEAAHAGARQALLKGGGGARGEDVSRFVKPIE